MTRPLSTTLGFVATLILGISTANADLILTLDDAASGGIEVIVADNVGAGIFLPDSGLTTTHADGSDDLGIVVFDGSIGDFVLNTAAGISKPVLGPPGEMGLFSVNSSVGPGLMTVSLTDTDFGAGLPFDIRNEIGGVTDGTVTSEWGADLDNVHFSFASAFGSQGPFGPGEFDSDSSIGPVGAAPSFSLTNTLLIAHSDDGDVTSLGSTVTVPEPSTVLLLIAAVPILSRRR